MDISVTLRDIRKAVAGLSIVAILLGFLAVSTANAAFKDVSSGDWFYSYVNQLVDGGIVNPGDYYRPGDNLNRAEMAKLAVLAAGFTDADLASPATASFGDVPSTAWFYKYVETAKQHGFVGGDPSGKFRPTDSLNRAEAAKILVNALELQENTAGGPHFSDVAEADWFYGVVETSYNWSVVDGYSGGLFKPGQLVNRGEIAKMIVLAQNPVARAEEGDGGEGDGEEGDEGDGGEEVSGGELAVALSGSSPAPVNLPSGSSYNTVAAFDFTAPAGTDVVLKGLTFTKGGYLANNKVTGVSVWDGAGKRHGNVVQTLTADAEAVIPFPDDPVTVKGGTTESVSVKINIDATVTSGTVYFGLAKAEHVTSTGVAAGSFPVNGATFGLVSGGSSLATVTLDVQPVNATGANLNVDEGSLQEITKFRVQETSSNEAIKLYSLALYNYGNASAIDYKEVTLVAQDGTTLATAEPVGQTVTFDLSASPYSIDKGLTKDFTVKAKIINGASKTIQFVVYNDYDLMVKGVTTDAYILSGAGTNDTAFPIGNQTATYNKVTIGSGTITFNKDSASPSTAVTPGSTNTVLAKYYAKAIGENMELRKVSLAITEQGTGTNLTGTVYIKVNDSTVYSAAVSGISTTSGTPTAITLSTYPVLAGGTTSYITVEASISSSADNTDGYKAFLKLTETKRLITNDIVDPSVNQAQGNLITVKAASLTITTLATPVAASIVPGATSHTFAKFELNAQNSGEDVKVTKLTVTDTLGDGAVVADLLNLAMYNAAGEALTTTTSTSTNAATVAFNFQTPIVVSKSATTVLSLKADVSSGVTGGATVTHKYSIADDDATIATGAVTGNSVAAGNLSTNGVLAGQAMTVATNGTLSLSLVSGTNASPAQNQLAALGTSGATYFAFKLTAQYEPLKVTSLKLTASGTALKQNDVRNIALYKGTDTTAFATAPQFSTCAANVCDYTWTATDNILPTSVDPASAMTIYVKADIGGEGIANLGDDFVMKINDVDADFIVKGASTNTTLNAASKSGTAVTSGITYVSPFNVVIAGDSPTSGSTVEQTVASGTAIGRFKITNNGNAQISVTNISFTNNGSDSGTLDTYDLYASSENSSNYTNTVLADESVNTVAFGDTTDVTINGGAYRYFTVYIGAVTTGLAAGNSWNLAVSSLGNVLYSVVETGLGYSGNPGTNQDLADTITGLYVDGKPVLGTITKK